MKPRVAGEHVEKYTARARCSACGGYHNYQLPPLSVRVGEVVWCHPVNPCTGQTFRLEVKINRALVTAEPDPAFEMLHRARSGPTLYDLDMRRRKD